MRRRAHCTKIACPLCEANRRGAANHQGHRGAVTPPSDRGVSMAEFLRRNSRGEGGGGRPPEPHLDELAVRWPALTEFLTLGQWEANKPRETGTVLICYDAGKWKAWVNDRDGEVTAWLSGDTLAGLLEALDRAIREDSLDWREVKRKKGR